MLCVSHSRKVGVAMAAADDAAVVGTGTGTGTGAVSAVAVAAAPGCCWDWEGSREKGGWAGVDVPDVLGVGSPLEEVEEGGSGGGEVVDATVPEDGCDAWVCVPLTAAAGPETELLWLLPLLLPLPLLPPPAPWLLLELMLEWLLPPWFVALLLEVEEDLKEERRFWAEDLRRI
jgi:hypothetical protein